MNHQKALISRRALIKLRLKKVGQRIWKQVKSWEFIYLLFYFVGQLLNIIFIDPSDLVTFSLPLIFLVLAVVTKMLMFKNKLTIKQFFRMQFDFSGPYVLTVIDIVLWIYTGFALQNYSQYAQDFPNFTTGDIVINSIQLFLSTFICSLLMHRRVTSKFQYVGILLIIVMQAVANLRQTIRFITTLNGLKDQLQNLNQYYIVQFVNQQITADVYNEYYALIAVAQSTLQSAKDFSLSSIASIISTLLVLLDMIGRPLQKIQHENQICSVLLERTDSDDRTSPLKDSIRRYSNLENNKQDDINGDESGIKKRMTDYFIKYGKKNNQNLKESKMICQKQSILMETQKQKCSVNQLKAPTNSKVNNSKQKKKEIQIQIIHSVGHRDSV